MLHQAQVAGFVIVGRITMGKLCIRSCNFLAVVKLPVQPSVSTANSVGTVLLQDPQKI